MTREQTLAKLRDMASDLRQQGVTALYLFGSRARDEARADSDVDLFLDYRSGSGFDLINLVEVERMIEERLDQPTDLTTRGALRPVLREKIVRESVRVF